mmetsp:Transcript_3028/g.12370  ORF Transcript_3028/g.12370 Transcript_3028/m.12370 type:complete len:385 (-) Transcript_3028:628-1782(-)
MSNGIGSRLLDRLPSSPSSRSSEDLLPPRVPHDGLEHRADAREDEEAREVKRGDGHLQAGPKVHAEDAGDERAERRGERGDAQRQLQLGHLVPSRRQRDADGLLQVAGVLQELLPPRVHRLRLLEVVLDQVLHLLLLVLLLLLRLRGGRDGKVGDVVVVVEGVQQHLSNRTRARVELDERLLRQSELLQDGGIDAALQTLRHLPAPLFAELHLGVQLRRRLLQRSLDHLQLKRYRRPAHAARGLIQVVIARRGGVGGSGESGDLVPVLQLDPAVAVVRQTPVRHPQTLLALAVPLPLLHRREESPGGGGVRLEEERVIGPDDDPDPQVDQDGLVVHQQRRGVVRLQQRRVDASQVSRRELGVSEQRPAGELLLHLRARIFRRRV